MKPSWISCIFIAFLFSPLFALGSFVLSTNLGPFAGGNVVLITNCVPAIGNGTDITNVTVGGVSSVILTQGTNWVSIIMPIATSTGLKDILIQSAEKGTTAFVGAYTYNPQGIFVGPFPSKDCLAGSGSACSMGLKADGTIVAWGDNTYGQAGGVPSPNTNFVAIAGGGLHSLGLKADGSIVAWGWETDGQRTVPEPNTNFIAVAGGYWHSLGLKADGSVVAWGANFVGQTSVPAPNANFVAIAGGGFHSVGLKANGTIVPWGGYDQASVPSPNTNFVAIASGGFHLLGLKANGTIVAWGRNDDGRASVPAPNTNFVAVAGGAFHSLGLKANGTIVAWGDNTYGQTNVPSPNTNFVAIATGAGGNHSLGLKSDGTIVAWGRNSAGQINVPEPNTNFGIRASPVIPSSGSLQGGYPVTICGVHLGNGNDITNVTLCGTPVQSIQSQSGTQVVVLAQTSAPGVGDVRVYSVSFGLSTESNGFTYVGPNASVIGTNGAILANGEAPDFTKGNAFRASPVGAVETRTFGITNNGNSPLTITGWTTNGNGASAFSISRLPSTISDGSCSNFTLTFQPKGAGSYTAVVSIANNSLVNPYVFKFSGWSSATMTTNLGPSAGGNVVLITNCVPAIGNGMDITNVTVGGVSSVILAQGTNWVSIIMPIATSTGLKDILIQSTEKGTTAFVGAYTYNPQGVIQIAFPSRGCLAGGGTHSLGLKANGTIVAWGGNSHGQTSVPAPNTNFIAVAGGGDYSLGLKANGTIVAWGDSSSGDSSSGQTSVPRPNTNFIAVAGGQYYSAGLKANGSIVAWSDYSMGQTNVPGPNTNFIAVAAGAFFALGLKANGTIVGWGYDNNGEASVPAPNTNFVAVAAGAFHSLGLKADGSIVAWGNNIDGQATVPEPNTNFIAVAGGRFHSLGLKTDGSIVAWGKNDFGQASVPSPNMDFVGVAAGEFHSLGLKANGMIVAWGNNNDGQASIPEPNTRFGIKIDRIGPVFPSYARTAGGYPVTIRGVNLGNGNDITNVTLCGTSVQSIQSQSATQVVVLAQKSAAGVGDVRVCSVSFGETIKASGFTYWDTMLTIVSDHGTAIPATGVCYHAMNAVVTNLVISPDLLGLTQYVCAGWTLLGQEPATGTTNQFVMTLTNSATLIWQWTTNGYWFAPTAGLHGVINGVSGWLTNGETVVINAAPDQYYHFVNWTGSLTATNNPLSLVMNESKRVTANFAANMTTNRPTPEWWLMKYGITNNFEALVDDDPDNDGIPTGDEWAMNTNPTNERSFLQATLYSLVYGTNCHDVVSTNSEPPYEVGTQIICNVIGQLLGWPCVSDRVYDVQYRLDVAPGTWVPVDGLSNIVSASEYLVITNTLDGNGQKFYRLNVRVIDAN